MPKFNCNWNSSKQYRWCTRSGDFKWKSPIYKYSYAKSKCAIETDWNSSCDRCAIAICPTPCYVHPIQWEKLRYYQTHINYTTYSANHCNVGGQRLLYARVTARVRARSFKLCPRLIFPLSLAIIKLPRILTLTWAKRLTVNAYINYR